MGTKTGISWTDATWNPIRGCSRVSEGCRHCYAESVAYRFSGPGLPYEGLVQLGADGARRPQWNGQIKFVEEHLLDPLRWKKPRRIFVNSMSDLFHENVTDQMRDKIFAVVGLCPQHEFQILTKRPEVAVRYYASRSWDWAKRHFIEHSDKSVAGEWVRRGMERAWVGVSVEDQKTANGRIPLLLQISCAARFISAEPLLGPIDLTDVPRVDLPGVAVGTPLLHWVIVGGESGAGARPMHPDWARSLRDQCKVAGVPFFFKQWGEWGDWDGSEENDHQATAVASIVNDERKWPTHLHNFGEDPENGDWAYRIGTKASGCLLDGVEHHEFPSIRG